MFTELLGKTIHKIQITDNDHITFVCTTGQEFVMYHSQDCCERVNIEDIAGDLEHLLSSPVTMAEEATNSSINPPEYAESFTWTFYKLATVKGYVTIRWLGQSNGYYSEAVTFEERTK